MSAWGRLARTSGSQTSSWLTTARVPVTQTISMKHQIGRASQLWTRNQRRERDFFGMGGLFLGNDDAARFVARKRRCLMDEQAAKI